MQESALTIVCEGSKKPQWIFDRALLPHIKMGRKTAITLKSVNTSNAGTYVCVAQVRPFVYLLDEAHVIVEGRYLDDTLHLSRACHALNSFALISSTDSYTNSQRKV